MWWPAFWGFQLTLLLRLSSGSVPSFFSIVLKEPLSFWSGSKQFLLSRGPLSWKGTLAGQYWECARLESVCSRPSALSEGSPPHLLWDWARPLLVSVALLELSLHVFQWIPTSWALWGFLLRSIRHLFASLCWPMDGASKARGQAGNSLSEEIPGHLTTCRWLLGFVLPYSFWYSWGYLCCLISKRMLSVGFAFAHFPCLFLCGNWERLKKWCVAIISPASSLLLMSGPIPGHRKDEMKY